MAEPPKKDGDLFESVGKKVESISLGHDSTLRNTEAATNTSTETEENEQDDGRVVDEIESLCMNCEENGTTRLLLTKIPFFREIVLMSFYCPHCHFKNSEIQAAGQIQERGCKQILRLNTVEDLSRQVVKSDTCVAKFEELEVEIPAGRGQLTNVEGLLSMILDDLGFGQPARKSLEPELYEKLETLIEKGRRMIKGQSLPFTLSLDDPAGNSSIEPSPDDKEGKLTRLEYNRTSQQNEALSLGPSNDKTGPAPASGDLATSTVPQSQDGSIGVDIVPDEVYSFPVSCPGCMNSCTTHMKMVDIPHFQEVIIMSTVCERCGYRSNDIKTGGAVPSKGRRITLKVEDAEDLSRDILKSESCELSSQELGLHVNPGSLGGRFTTVEGILTQIRSDLHSQIFDTDNESNTGDSLASDTKSKWNKFFDDLGAAIRGELKFTLVLEDPLASSYVQSLTAPDPDPQLFIEDYERTEEQEEELGLNDIKTEGYEEPTVEDGELVGKPER